MKKNKILTPPLLVLLVVSLLMIISLFSFIFYMGRMESPCFVVSPPEISAEVVDQNNGTYLITLTKVDTSNMKTFSVDLNELRVFILFENQTLMQRDLTAVLNNTSSNVSFYDLDGDGMLSAGDEFIVRGNLAVREYELCLVDQNAGDMKAIPLEPTTTSSVFESGRPPYLLVLAMSVTVLVSVGILLVMFRRKRRYG